MWPKTYIIKFMKSSALAIMHSIARGLVRDHYPISLRNLDGTRQVLTTDGLSSEQLERLQSFLKGTENKCIEHIKSGDYTMFVILGDLYKITNEIINPLKLYLREDEKYLLDVEFKEMSVEEFLSSRHEITSPIGRNGGVLVIEGIERLDYGKDYVSKFLRLTKSPIQTSVCDNLSRWSLIFISRECENDYFLFNSTWNYFRRKSWLEEYVLE